MDVAFDDPAAIAALRSRDEARVRQLVAAWTPGMLRLARAHTVSDATAEDAVQDAWVTVLTGIERFEGRSTLRTWVMGIVINTARRAGAREHRTLPFSATGWADRGDEWDPAVAPGRFHPQTGHWVSSPLRWDLLPEEQLTAAELRTVIDTALTALPQRQRAVMIARDVLGLSGEEVCTLYMLGDGNQRVLLHRGRNKVRAAVELYAATSTGRPDTAAVVPSRARMSEQAVQRRPARPGSREPVVCRQLVELVTDYLEGTLDTGLRDRVQEHLAACHHCNGYVAQVRRMLDLTAGLAPTAPLHIVARLAAALRNATGSDITTPGVTGR
ncbi:MAG: sigma-70 family RNA polymerase sigma factor [Actinomycetota bacterium]|nr:sigma-70 family RNA polymerase sigma factor [Actinomycetota bacterium]